MKNLYLPGYGNSLQGHWQRIWFENDKNGIWVEQKSWGFPERNAWLSTLNEIVDSIDEPFTIIAHSLGCLLYTDWLTQYQGDKLAGVFLAGIPDSEKDSFPEAISNFQNPSNNEAYSKIPTVLIASEDDPYATIEFSTKTAQTLNSKFINIGKRGHINHESGLDNWEDGKKILESLEKY